MYAFFSSHCNIFLCVSDRTRPWTYLPLSHGEQNVDECSGLGRPYTYIFIHSHRQPSTNNLRDRRVGGEIDFYNVLELCVPIFISCAAMGIPLSPPPRVNKNTFLFQTYSSRVALVQLRFLNFSSNALPSLEMLRAPFILDDPPL